MTQKVSFIEISIGQLPKWYLKDEGNNDIILEEAIETEWHKNPAYRNAQISVSYNYSTEDARVKAYNDDGDLVFERDNHDYSYALKAVKDRDND